MSECLGWVPLDVLEATIRQRVECDAFTKGVGNQARAKEREPAGVPLGGAIVVSAADVNQQKTLDQLVNLIAMKVCFLRETFAGLIRPELARERASWRFAHVPSSESPIGPDGYVCPFMWVDENGRAVEVPA